CLLLRCWPVCCSLSMVALVYHVAVISRPSVPLGLTERTRSASPHHARITEAHATRRVSGLRTPPATEAHGRTRVSHGWRKRRIGFPRETTGLFLAGVPRKPRPPRAESDLVRHADAARRWRDRVPR